MSVDFGMDGSQAGSWMGYISGFTSKLNTTEYIGSVMQYASSALTNAFELAMDDRARLNPEQFHHVYEWGKDYGSYETVGNPADRLWKMVITGNGRDRAVSYVFLPSTRPVPIEQALLVPGKKGKTVLTDVHIFTWKATVMEYGLPVSISPKLGKFIVFPDPKTGKIIFTTRTINTVPGKDKLRGNFHTFYNSWWTAVAPVIFDRQIRPFFEKSIKPKDEKGRFRTWTSAERRNQRGQSATTLIKSYEAGVADGVEEAKRQAIDYVARARGRRLELYGY